MTTFTALPDEQRRNALWFLAVAVVGAAVGLVGTRRPALGLALLLLCAGACLVVARPVHVAVLAVPGLYAIQGVGGGGAGPTDLLIVTATLLALPALTRAPGRHGIAPLLWAFAGYLALLAPSVIAHPSSAAVVEVVHRLVIVPGAVLVGAWLVQERSVAPALRLLVLVSAGFAVVSVLTWLTNGHQAAYPLGFHKNYMGTLLALVLLIALCLPHLLGLPTWVRLSASGLIVLGVLACQSRGAILGAALGGLVWLFAPRSGTHVTGRARLLAAVLALGFGLYAGYSVQEQLTSQDVSTSSAGVRREVEAFTRDLWRTSPVDGVGIRYFNSGQYGPLAQASNNAINNELAEAGLAGATGFVLFHTTALVLLWRRRRTALGVAALALLSGQLLHGMFDIYWSSGITPLPFLLAGMALASRPDEDESAAPAATTVAARA